MPELSRKTNWNFDSRYKIVYDIQKSHQNFLSVRHRGLNERKSAPKPFLGQVRTKLEKNIFPEFSSKNVWKPTWINYISTRS